MIALNPREIETAAGPEREFVVHPMFDVAEEKRSGEGLGLMTLSPGVRLCLFGLRAYLLLMTLLLGYHLLDQAGVFGHRLHS